MTVWVNNVLLLFKLLKIRHLQMIFHESNASRQTDILMYVFTYVRACMYRLILYPHIVRMGYTQINVSLLSGFKVATRTTTTTATGHILIKLIL